MSERITTMLGMTAEVIGYPVSPESLDMMTEDLCRHPEADVREALIRVRRECRRLTLPDILDRLPSKPPGTEQAWEMAMEAQIWDENATVIVHKAIMQAFPSHLWGAGDKVAARMAFKEAYPQAVHQCGNEIMVSLGVNTDPERRDEFAQRREAALEAAFQQGLISERKRALLTGGPSTALPLLEESSDQKDRRLVSVTEGLNKVLAALNPDRPNL